MTDRVAKSQRMRLNVSDVNPEFISYAPIKTYENVQPFGSSIKLYTIIFIILYVLFLIFGIFFLISSIGGNSNIIKNKDKNNEILKKIIQNP